MKRRIYSFLIVFFILASCYRLDGQAPVNGDYRSHQTGAWNVAGNWEKYNGSIWVFPAPEFPPLASPWITKRVTIQSGHIISATGPVIGTSAGVLEVAAGGRLEMDSYPIRGTTTSAKFPTVIINGVLNTSTWVSSTNISVGSGGIFITSYPGAVGWWYINSFPNSVTMDGQLTLSGTSGQILPNYEYHDVVLSGGAKTMTGDVTINGTLTIDADAILEVGTSVLISTGSGIIIDGMLDAVDSYLNFDGGTQTVSGTGIFGETMAQISLSSSSTVSISNPNLLKVNEVDISSGSTLSLGSDCRMTIFSSLVTNNGLILEASETNPSTCASLIIESTASVTGNISSELYLTGGAVPDGHRWHLISSPFTSLNITPISSVTLDLAQWVESYDRMSLDEGWVAFDGFIYPTGPSTGPTFSSLTTGKGYTYYFSSAHNYTISGQPNISDVNVTLSCFDPGLPELYGHNLLGNPFTSGLDWDAIINDPGFPAYTSKALHYRKNGTHVYYVNGVGSEPGVNGIIPPMQGFFVKTNADGGVINLAASARVHDNIPARYKGSKNIIPLIRLKINTGDLADYAVVRFDDDAKTGVDYDFDAMKEFLSAARPSIYSVSEASKFVINGLPFPSPSTDIPVAIKIITAGSYTISAHELSGLENYSVKLIDNNTGTITNLQTSPSVTFASTAGLFPNRFVLRVAELSTDIDDPSITPDKQFTIYNSNGLINILTWSNEWDNKTGSVTVYDLGGRIIKSMPQVFLSQTSIIQMESPEAKGLYIVEIKSGLKRFSAKLIIP